jgi:hypothetical protein
MKITAKSDCPCHLGKEYGQCHSPTKDKSDSNLWRGPGYPQHIYLGYEEQFSGYEFENKQKGEIVLLKDDEYKEVIEQVLGYGTAWTTEYATVMINPGQGSIVNKFLANAEQSPGFKDFRYLERERKPIQKLISHHYSAEWDRYFDIVHFIINLNFLK